MKVETPENPKSSSAKKLGTSGGSIDIYAVQCEKCFKWRVIDSQEEYEDIRSKFKDKPYTCSRKPGKSCSDPADIEYDATRTWVIDKPNIPKTPEGFKRNLVLRKDFSKLDAYYVAPTGKKMRTLNEVSAFLDANPQYKGMTVADFSFHCPKVMDETIPDHVEKKGSASGNKRPKTARDQE
ncbi:hypothetical protein MLD38_028090 [Melastoma candidum]|uniref:Uncharacterized protein n=1 Tax=Melastoma candidum TaxID=119954 RepID=A0ACB9MZT4_9MYRT|nr:hypothetical protein MLD38_028090 [Melastoma candidum]